MRIFKICLNVLYPPLCLYCEQTLEEKRYVFCSACLEQLCLIEKAGRCPTCFAEIEQKCERCMKRSVVIKRQAAACYCEGAAKKLIHFLERGDFQFLKATSSLLALQFFNLGWPLPDVIIPLPSFNGWIKKGKDVNGLLAKQMSRLLERPLTFPFLTIFDRQSFLERGEFNLSYSYRKKKSEAIRDKRILLIALQFDDEALRRVAFALQEGFPSEIFALACAM